MQTITVEGAQSHLGEILDKLVPGHEVVITRDNRSLASLVRAEGTNWPCKAGSAKDTVHWADQGPKRRRPSWRNGT
jgi:antitoxin (DNA-binding transcriptional repressor) of toxin-antitoxin stability system